MVFFTTAPCASGIARAECLPAQQPAREMSLYVCPFRRNDTVHVGIAGRAVAPRLMVTQHAIALGTEPLDGALRAEVEVVGAQPDDRTAERLEGVREKQQLRGGVDVTALPARRIPCISDLHAVDGRDDVV